MDVGEAGKLPAEAEAKLEEAELNHEDTREADKLRAGLKNWKGTAPLWGGDINRTKSNARSCPFV